MAFLEADAKNIASGWSPEPQLKAPEIGPTLAAILNNRRLQQQQTQDTLSAAIKAQQDRNQASAYGSALQSAGVVPGGVDLSNMSGPDLSRLATLYQETIPDTDLDKSRQAEAAKNQAMADAIKNGTYGAGRGGAGGANTAFIYDDVNDPDHQNPVPVARNSKIYQDYLRSQISGVNPPDTPSVAATIATKMGLPPQAITDTSQHAGMGLVPGSGVDASGRPYESKYLPVSPGDEPTDIKVTPTGTDPKTQQPYQPVIMQKDTLEQLRRGLQGPSYKPSGNTNAATVVPRFGSEDAARSAGKQAGDQILLYDPSSGQYRPAVLH